MVFPRRFLSLAAAMACLGSLAEGSPSTSSGRGPRYEPTRPGQVAYNSAMMAQHRQGDRYDSRRRFEPTRPGQLADNGTTMGRPAHHRQRPRYEPTRPNRSSSQRYSPKRSQNNQWEAVNNRYDQLTSAQNNYERWDSRYRDYQKAKKWHQKVAKGGKTLFKPVKFAFKLSKKAVSKATLGWLPLL